jgi:hypothetical protein
MGKFETFTKRMVPLAAQPYVTIQKRGVMSFNAAAHALLGQPEAIELLFDRDEQLVGVRKVAPTVEHAYPIRRAAANDTTYMVSGTAFTKYYGIDTSESVRRPAVMREDVLVIDLKEAGTVVTGNRKKQDEAPVEHSA